MPSRAGPGRGRPTVEGTDSLFNFENTTIAESITLTAHWADPVTLTATMEDADGMTVSGTITFPEGDVFPGDEVTLTAPKTSGYNFTGWFAADDLTANLCPDRAYTFIVGGVTSFVAKYEALPTVSITIESAKSYTINGSTQIGKVVKDYPLGAEITVSTNGENFNCWKNSYGKVLSTTASYTFIVAVYRKIAERMPEYDTFLFHGSCVSVDGAGYLFTAKSGTGKSTHTRLWRELLGNRAAMVNDDKPLIRMTDEGAIVHGTPWDGKHHLSNNIAVPLKAVCILERSSENRIREITPSEVLPMLLQQVYRPMNAGGMAITMNLIDRLAGRVKLYRLGCNMNIEAAKVAWSMMGMDG